MQPLDQILLAYIICVIVITLILVWLGIGKLTSLVIALSIATGGTYLLASQMQEGSAFSIATLSVLFKLSELLIFVWIILFFVFLIVSIARQEYRRDYFLDDCINF